jgi:hypothetical protein
VNVVADGSGAAGAWTLIGIVFALAALLTFIGIAQARDPARRPLPPLSEPDSEPSPQLASTAVEGEERAEQ